MPSIFDTLGFAAKVATADVDEVIDLVGQGFGDELGGVVADPVADPSAIVVQGEAVCERCDGERKVVARGQIVACPACASHPGARR